MKKKYKMEVSQISNYRTLAVRSFVLIRSQCQLGFEHGYFGIVKKDKLWFVSIRRKIIIIKIIWFISTGHYFWPRLYIVKMDAEILCIVEVEEMISRVFQSVHILKDETCFILFHLYLSIFGWVHGKGK